MADRSHLSIGEVLSLLREEFPDVTISKIRFLESQGLVDPERTPSGYRKFYDHDVERLRWILRQQRENFLPLKIIRGRLTEHGDEADDSGHEGHDGHDDHEGHGGHDAEAEPSAVAADPLAPGAGQPSHRPRRPAADTSGTHPSGGARHRAAAAVAPELGSVVSQVVAPPPPPPRIAAGPVARPSQADPPPASGPASPDLAAATRFGTASRFAAAGQLPLGDDADTYSAEELAHAAGGTAAIVKELQQFGLISARIVVGGMPYFDATAVEVVRAAASFARHGVEARHLRAWRNAADREAGLFEQVIMPLLRQRNPEARKQAAATLSELATLGGDLRKALIDQALRQIR